MKLLNCFHSVLIISSLFVLLSCSNQQSFYKKEFSEEKKLELAKQMIAGRGYYYQGSEGEQMILKESCAFNPKSGTVWREFGVPYLKRGFAAEWFENYEKAVSLDPLNWTGWQGYLYLYFYRDYERAIQCFDKTDDLTPDVVDYPQSLSVDYMRGISYLKLDKYKEALDYFNKHITYESESTGVEYIGSNTFLYKGITQMKMSDLEEAILTFKLGLVYNPDNSDLMFWIAKAKFEQRENFEALRYVRNAIIQFKKGQFNERGYTEEFFQSYLPEMKTWERKIEDAMKTQVKSI